jgi:DNA-binding MarR family transcriptional regulator
MVDPSVAKRIGIALREIRRGTAQDLRSRLYGELVELAQADALEVLVHRRELTMSELAAELRVDASAATRTVRRLTDAGLVARTTLPSDARAVIVSLTEEGESLVIEILRRSMSAVEAILDEFDAGEQGELADLLERFVVGIDRARARTLAAS